MNRIRKAMSIRSCIVRFVARGIACSPEMRMPLTPRFLFSANESPVCPAVFCAAACLGLLGCGSSSAKPDVGPITVTNLNGVSQPAIKSLTVGSGTYLDVTITNDKNLLGADWTVTCSSELPPGTPLPPGQTIDTSCGYFTPAHTASAPVPSYADNADGIVTYYTSPAAPPKSGTVTLYASASADHSQFSTLTLAIAGQPISIAIVGSPPPPFSLAPGQAMSLTGTLSNDYMAGEGGIKWSLSCGSSECGSLSSTTSTSGTPITYTAPAAVPNAGAVVVTATSAAAPAASDSIVITIA
jgi:hypothetical protein